MTSPLTSAVEQILGTRVLGATRLPHGLVNEVYRVETTDGVVVVKVFRHRTWPEADKPPWVERQLRAHGVPHAPLLYYSRADTYFPHGLSISEHVAGTNALDLLRAGQLSPVEFATKTGRLLRRLHGITVARYGYLNGGAGMYESLVEFKLTHEVGERLATLPAGALPADVQGRVATLVARNLAPLEPRLRPVLVHDDPKPDNVIWTAAGEPVLVDWDEAVGSAWLSDYARLTYWLEGHGAAVVPAGERAAFRAAFFAAYGPVDLSADEIVRAEHALHVVHAADLTAFYDRRQDETACARIRARLLRLLG